MSKKIPVSQIYPYLKTMLDDKWGYIYKKAGILWTEKLQKATTDDMAQKYGKKWIGHMVTDCSGVMVYIWKKFGLSIPHGSNSMVKQGYVGKLSKTAKPGYAALKYKPENDDYSHIGIVGEDGMTVYEAKGTQYGFVTSKTSSWDLFGPFTQVDYTESKEDLIKMEPYFASITGDKVRLRSGPGVNYPKIGEMNTGDLVEVMAESGNWVFAKVGNTQGYIFSKYVEKIEGTIIVDDANDVITGVFIPEDLALALYEALKEGLGK